MTSVSKVIIIGGGIGGLTLARACLDVGIAVELYEKRGLDVMLSGPGGIFIQRNALRVYKLLQSGQIYQRFYIREARSSKVGFLTNKANPSTLTFLNS
jgi:2-polyprenyl-6-methoxyphenol hydroxylase-like FAD-dependent oxidoreductase